jgi:hypothetical protein
MGRRLETEGIQHTRQVFGLLEDSRVNENFLSKLLEELPPGESELYSHPSLDEFRHEYEALMSERVKRMVEERKIELICYRDI